MFTRYAAVALVALAACTPAGTDARPTPVPTGPAATTLACGPVTPRVTARPGSTHLRVGPVALFAGPEPGITLRVREYALTRRVEVLQPGGELVVTGRHCTTGDPLRFWTTGDIPAPTSSRPPAGGDTRLVALDGVTYFLFDRAGRWELNVTRDGRVAGTAVVEVTG